MHLFSGHSEGLIDPNKHLRLRAMCLKLMAKIAACPSKISPVQWGEGALQALTSGSHFCQDHSSGELDQTIISSFNLNSNPLNACKHFGREKEIVGCVLSHSHPLVADGKLAQLAWGGGREGGDKF